MSTKYVVTQNILKDGNILTPIVRKGDLCQLLGSDGHTATCKRLVNGETFTCDMASLKQEAAEDFLENELELK